MFKGITPSTFLNTPEEWHAFVIGYFETVCPWRAVRPICKESEKQLKGEYHYYVAGRALGLVALMLILIGFAKLAKEALL